jgi:hypothetical protein
MQSSGVLCHVAPVKTDVSEERQFLQEPHGVTPQRTAFFKTKYHLQKLLYQAAYDICWHFI